MGKNQSASNITNIIKQDGSGNIVFTSGSTTLATISTTGQLSGSTAVKSATTASYADNFTVTGNLTAQTLVVQTITSSVDFVTGSTRFGSFLTNTHVFSGSVAMNPGGLFVSGSGNVGIGTTTPGTALEVYNATQGNVYISTSGSNESCLRFYSGGNELVTIRSTGNGTLGFETGTGSPAERMRITATGNVGIGTLSPNIGGYGSNSRILTIQGTAGSYGILELTSNSANADGSAIGRLDFGSDGQAANYKAISSVASFLSGTTSTKFGADLRFYTRADNAASGDPSERMRINSIGNIGIGTSFPVTTSLTGSLTVVKSYNADGASVPSTTAQSYHTNQSALYLFGRNSGVSIISNNGEEGAVIFGNASTNAYASIKTGTGTSSTGGDMYFQVGSNTERMRITTGGNVGIGTNNPLAKLDIKMSGDGDIFVGRYSGGAAKLVYAYQSGNDGFLELRTGADGIITKLSGYAGTSSYFLSRVLVGQTTPDLGQNGWNLSIDGGGHTSFAISNNEAFIFNNRNTGTTYEIDFRTNSVERGKISVTDSGTSYVTTSDYRVKEDFKDFNGLEKVSAIKVYNFKFKDMDLRTDGVIAHELQEVLPYAVTGEKDGTKYQGVDYAKLTPVLVKAIQELNTKLDAANAEIEVLKNK